MSSCCAKGSGKRRSTIVDGPETLPNAGFDDMDCELAPLPKLPRRIQASLGAASGSRAASLGAAVHALPASKLPMIEASLKKQAPGANTLVAAIQQAMDVGSAGVMGKSAYWKGPGARTLPSLGGGDFWVVEGESPRDAPYNCLAHVIGDRSRVHWPGESMLGDAFDLEIAEDDLAAQQEREASTMPALPVEQFDTYLGRHGFDPVAWDEGVDDEDDLPVGTIMAYGEGAALMHFALKVPGGWESKTGPIGALLFHARLDQLASVDNGRPMRVYRPRG
jgi:hypothetical protein